MLPLRGRLYRPCAHPSPLPLPLTSAHLQHNELLALCSEAGDDPVHPSVRHPCRGVGGWGGKGEGLGQSDIVQQYTRNTRLFWKKSRAGGAERHIPSSNRSTLTCHGKDAPDHRTHADHEVQEGGWPVVDRHDDG